MPILSSHSPTCCIAAVPVGGSLCMVGAFSSGRQSSDVSLATWRQDDFQLNILPRSCFACWMPAIRRHQSGSRTNPHLIPVEAHFGHLPPEIALAAEGHETVI